MKIRIHSASRLFLQAQLALLAVAPFAATAADYALLMGIGEYQRPQANLPGIDKDVALARRIAQSIGVPAANIRELSDRQVTREGVYAAMREIERLLHPGDRVFIYYSGHGAQEKAAGGGARCSEGMFVHDMKLVPDGELETALGRIAAKAGQVVMFNDSCFSGGAASKDGQTRSMSGVPKYFKAVSDRPDYVCGEAVNMKNTVRNLVASATAKGNNFVYIAAAADDEVAMATSNGSAATLAWESCMRNPRADSNGSGALDANELQACAQREVDRMGHRQTITSLGNRNLPISFAAQGAPPVSGEDAARRSAATLEDIRQAASPGIRVDLQTRRQVVIDQDPLDFSVRSSRAGYLYLLHVGSDGQTFNLLFPNDLDRNNYVQANATVRLPRPSWRVKAGGPSGESYVMAIVSESQKDFHSLTSKQGPFKSAEFGPGLQRTLRVESTGIDAPSGQGRFGASRVIGVREVMR
jgi:hypothetical protein